MRPIVVLADLGDQSVNEVRQILFDWYLSGLVQPIVWLDARPGDRSISAVVDGQIARLSLSVWLDKYLPSGMEVELFSLQVANEEKRYFNNSFIEEALKDFPVLVAAEPKMVNVLAPADQADSIPDNSLLPYRTNIAILPIQGASGYAGYQVLKQATSEFFANVAAGLASCTATWAGMETNPLYDLPVAKQRKPEVILLRSFARYADASGLVLGMVEDVTSEPSGRIPGAYDDFGERLTPNPDDSSLRKTITVAENFIAQNQAMFSFGNLPDRPKLQPKPLSWRDLLREYGSYLRKYFKVGSWIRDKIDGYKAAAANSLQQIFLGDSSAREVFVLGVSSDTPRNDDSTLNAIDALLNATTAVSQSVMEPALTNPNDIWREYVVTVTSLVDGSTGISKIEMPGVIGGDRRLILNPNHLAPAPDFRNFRIPENLPIRLRGEVVRPTDPYLAMLLDDQLDSVLQNPSRYTPVDIAASQKTKQDLALWKSDVDSFAWRVGSKLAQSLNEARATIGKIPSAAEENDDSFKKLIELEANARKALGRIVKGFFGIIGGSLVAWLGQAIWLFLAIGAWPVALATSWLWPAAAVAAIVSIWAAMGFQAFAGAVRDIYKHENQARYEQDIAVWVEGIRPKLRAEVSKLADLYKQLELWNRLLVPILYEPLGSVRRSGDGVTTIRNLNQLTSSIQLAEFKSSGDQRGKLLDDVKSSFFHRGWLYSRFENHLIQLGAELPKTWSDTAQEDKSALRKMLDKARGEYTRSALGKQTLLEVQEIARLKADYANWPVQIVNLNRELSCQEYLSGLANGIGALPAELLEDSAAVAGKNRLDTQRSFFVRDIRIDATSDVTQVISNPNSVDPDRRLDLMSVRVEVSKPMKYTDFVVFFETDSGSDQQEPEYQSPVA
jgi:hypothetical protein